MLRAGWALGAFTLLVAASATGLQRRLDAGGTQFDTASRSSAEWMPLSRSQGDLQPDGPEEIYVTIRTPAHVPGTR